MTAGVERPGRAVGSVAAKLALVYSLLMAAPLLWGFFEGDGASLFGALLAATWSAAPAYGAALFARASATEGGSLFFLAVELLIMASFALAIVDSAILHPGSTDGLLYLTLPLAQWGALILAAALAALCGWRARENWPDPPAGGHRR